MTNDLIKNWENAYATLENDSTLWGEKPIPYISEICDLFHSINAKRVLDFPCGDGRNTVVLSREFDMTFGADSSQSALSILNRKFNASGASGTCLVKTDLFSSCFLDEYFDAILCWDVLGHLENPNTAIEELLRICKPGGMIIGSFFSETEPGIKDAHMERINEHDYSYKNKYFYRLYSKKMLMNLMSNFKNIDEIKYEHVVWKEPPHEGFREYEHEHHSWAVIITKEE